MEKSKPFLDRSGKYQFQFSLRNNKIGIWINYSDKEGNKQLFTALTGKLIPLTIKSLRRVFWKYPLVTWKTMILIHWQAVKLFFKGLFYYSKPKQLKDKVSTTTKLWRFVAFVSAVV